MNLNRRHFLGAIAVGTAGLVAPRAFAAVRADDPPALLARAMAAMQTHSRSITNRDIIGLVDIGNGRIISSMLVSHGRGSDPANSGWVERFSNRHGSNASSSGSFVTGDTYFGKHGRSRRLTGLDADNNQALSRGIVIHAASYVDDGMARTQGRIGRSQGCFAVSNAEINGLLARLGSGRLLYASKQASLFAARQGSHFDG